MPRNYNAIKKCKTHDPKIIKTAIEEVLKGGASYRKVATKYEIDHTVLYRHVKRNGTTKKKGGQTALSEEEEKMLVSRLQICCDWGYPIDPLTFRLLVKDFIDRQGKTVPKFKDNLPGPDFTFGFMKRHKDALSTRICQNIKRSRAAISKETINEYFDNVQVELKDVPPCNIVNYDETNLSDDPGRKLIIARRGCKYPERIMNSTKSSISVMFAASGSGEILPPYVVYKAQHIYDSWRVGGPLKSRYNRTKSGWFDSYCFQDWVETIAIPYLKNLNGVKILLGDNLSSHLSLDVIKLCQENNIKFVFLPSNSTHLTQPLDVAFFRPLKQSWRTILEKWKQGPGRMEASLPKDRFPPLLKELCATLKQTNVIAGFKKCGLVPLDRNQVLSKLPSISNSNESNEDLAEVLNESFKQYLSEIRKSDLPQPRKKRVKVAVNAGKSVEVEDFVRTPSDEVTALPTTSTAGSKHRKKCQKKQFTDSDTTDSDCSFQNEDKEFSESSSEEDTNNVLSLDKSNSKFSLGEFAVIKVMGKTKNSCRLYVVKVIEFDEEGYIGRFYKKTPGVFKFAQTDEEALFKAPEDVIRRLNKPNICSSGRYQGSITFLDDFEGLSLY